MMKSIILKLIKNVFILFLLISVFPNRVTADDGSFYSNLGTGFNNQVNSISIQSDGKILVGGRFTTFDGNTRNRLVRLNSDGTEDTDFYTNLGSGFDDGISTISIQSDGKILVGGSFNTFDGNTRSRLVRLNSDGTEDTDFYTSLGSGFDDQLNSISIQSDGKILVGGSFTDFDGNTRNYLIRLNSDGTEDLSFSTNFGTGFGIRVNSISIQSDGKILVGGRFTTLDGNTRNHLVRLNSDGTEDTSFYSNLGTGFGIELYNTLVQSDGKILVVGSFTSFNDSSRNRLVRLNSDGTEDTSFYTNLGSGFNAAVSAISIQSDGKILVGGYYNGFNSNTRNLLVRLNSNGTEDTAFYASLGSGFNVNGLNSAVFTTSIQNDGKILVGGSFTSLDGNTRNSIVRLGPSVRYSGNFSELVVNNGSVTGSRIATLNGDTFATTLTDGVHYTVTNVPAGLTAVMTRTSNTVATLTLTGNAVDHGSIDSVSDLTITWLDGAFTIATTSSLMSGYTDDNGSIQFVDPFVGYSGEFLETELNNGSVTGSRVATLSGDTFASTLTDSVHYTVTNVPAGLTAVMTRTSDTVATLTLIGNAVDNASDDSVSDITITWLDGAFVTATTASDLSGYFDEEGYVEFIDQGLSTNTSGTNIFLTYGVELDSESLPLPEDFGINVNGDSITVESVTISGTTVTLAVSPTIFIGDDVVLYYYPEDFGDPIIGLEGFYADEIDGQEVTNNSTVVRPGLTSLSTNTAGTNILLTYNVGLDSESLPLPEDFEVYVNDELITVESVNISGTFVTLVVSPTILVGDNITLSYTAENFGSPIIGLSDFYAENIDGQEVTNNVQSVVVPSITPTAPIQISGPTAVSSAPLSSSEIQKIFGNLLRSQATSTATSSSANNQNNENTSNNGAGPVSFTRNLQLNSRGEDVRNLQRFLNQNGFSVATSGAGSPGRETNLFGPATRRALIRYQQANNIRPAIGFFGVITRGFMSR
jgi:uncharacterized delta-60 repeat protein/uncharacterized repeat protein (TIGR02059 family)